MLRIFYVAVPELRADWRLMMWVIAVATVVVGNHHRGATDRRRSGCWRILAVSAVSSLTGVVALNDSGLSGTLFHLVACGLLHAGRFAVISVVRDADGEEATTLAHWAGWRTHPVVCAVFSLFLLAFAGIPLTSGFCVEDSGCSEPAAGAGPPMLVWSSVIATHRHFTSACGVIVLMFFRRPTPTDGVITPGWTSKATVALTAIVCYWKLAPAVARPGEQFRPLRPVAPRPETYVFGENQ